MTNLEDIKKAIYDSGLTECESRNCEGCSFGKYSPESKEFGNASICMMLNEIYRTK